MPFDHLTDDEVGKNYAEEKFPDVTRLPAGNIIRSCWTEQFKTAEDVRIALGSFKTDDTLCDPKKVILNTRSHINKSWPLILISR
jgi:hypothetical protein